MMVYSTDRSVTGSLQGFMMSRWLLAILLVNCMRPRQCCSEWLYGITVFEVQTFEPNDEATGPLVQ